MGAVIAILFLPAVCLCLAGGLYMVRCAVKKRIKKARNYDFPS